MLRQFNVYRNPSSQTNKILPYYMIVQNDCYDDFSTRVIIPLMRNPKLPLWHLNVAPKINVEFESLTLYSPMLTNLETSRIHHKDFICNLRSARRDVVNAIDALITNV